MSYRNPPIIIDRSTDVWGTAIAKFGEQVSKGIISAGEAAKKAGEEQAEYARKTKLAMQTLETTTRESYMDSARDSYLAMKKSSDASIANQFKVDVEKMLNGTGTPGEEGYKIGAIDAKVQLSLNTDLNDETRKYYNSVIEDSKTFQDAAVDGFGKVISSVTELKGKDSNTLGKPGGYTYRGGSRKEKLENQLAFYAVDPDAMINPDVIETRKTSRGDNNENFLETTTLVPADQFKEGEVFGDIYNGFSDKEKEEVEKVIENGKEYYKFSWKKDVNEWDGEFTTDLLDTPDFSKLYKEAGIEDEEGTVSASLTTTSTLKNGDNLDTYELIDINRVKNNASLNQIMMGSAAGVESATLQEKEAYLQEVLDKGGMTVKEFNKTYKTPKERAEYLKNALVDYSVKSKFNGYTFRQATQEDVDRFRAVDPNSTMSIGTEIASKKTSSKYQKPEVVKLEEDKEPTESEIGRARAVKDAPTFYSDMFEKPSSFFRNKTINGNKISKVTLTGVGDSLEDGKGKSKGKLQLGYETGKSTGGKEQIIYEDTMVFDLNDPTRVRALIDMLPNANEDMKVELKKILKSKSSKSKEADPVKPDVNKQSKALLNFKNRTGREATNIFDLSPEDWDKASEDLSSNLPIFKI